MPRQCGPILGHMLDGLDAGAAPPFGAGAIGADEPHAVFEDAWLVIVDKPAGLLSVVGRAASVSSVPSSSSLNTAP